MRRAGIDVEKGARYCPGVDALMSGVRFVVSRDRECPARNEENNFRMCPSSIRDPNEERPDLWIFFMGSMRERMVGGTS